MFDLITILESIEGNLLYLVTLSFFAWYPLVSSGVLVIAAVAFYLRRERQDHPRPSPDFVPSVSVVISAFIAFLRLGLLSVIVKI